MAAIIATSCCGSKDNSQTPIQGSVKTVDYDEFEKIISDKSVRIIDVRTAKEFAESHIAKAENHDVNASDFADNFTPGKCGKNKNVLAVYCRSGRRSLKAADILSKKGFTVYNLGGGIMAWQRAGKAVTK